MDSDFGILVWSLILGYRFEDSSIDSNFGILIRIPILGLWYSF